MRQYLGYLIPFIDPKIRSWTWEARLLNWLTCVWLIVGLVTLVSASYPESIINNGDGLYIFKRQLIGVGAGIIGFNLMARKPLGQTLKYSPVMVLFFLVLIFATLVPGLGKTTMGASRWIAIGPFSLQPSELIKPFLVLQAAYIFSRWNQLSSKVRLVWMVVFALVLAGILKQPNLSTTGLCGMSLWLIAVAAELPWTKLLTVSIGGISVASLSVAINPYQLDRITSFINPWQDYHNKGYQLIQSLLAIASGSFNGSGFGLSQQKLSYLPIRSTDFIFAVYAEEFGFIGSLLLLSIIIGYGTLALRVAIKCHQTIPRLVAIGSMVFIVGQSLINIAVATGSLPTTGLPLPFFSYGINSIIASLLLAGLLVRVARESNTGEVVQLKQIPLNRRTLTRN
ncbi:FtsW/RodA/SpoVE family cell cycle protein [Waterburya agarophytonicola K14]|uniref:Probable peptidoglycan glycosyltransferase FtsW n=1 Tax=Waterburya agarophytonicola KI4 TaxID=2874699 RepID=A0A964BRT1_9CYAN|nr:FtsW/RodA/SpoVE family cell cycle protein [Waterburya agarophytonicola]MCC0177592.1 FtsW/RodA/SpoVE family cell cycle protein [Waterburya agarophytonicola KI4]